MDERPRSRRRRASNEPAPDELPWDRPADYDAPTDTVTRRDAAWDRPGDDGAPWAAREPDDGGGTRPVGPRSPRTPMHAAAAISGRASIHALGAAPARPPDAQPWPSGDAAAGIANSQPGAVGAESDPDDALAPVLDDVAPFVRVRAQQFVPPGQRPASAQAARSAEDARALEPPDLARQGVGPTPPDGLVGRPAWEGYGELPAERAGAPVPTADYSESRAVFEVPLPRAGSHGGPGQNAGSEQLMLRIELAIVDDAARRPKPAQAAATAAEPPIESRATPAPPGPAVDASWLARPVNDPLVALSAPPVPGRDEALGGAPVLPAAAAAQAAPVTATMRRDRVEMGEHTDVLGRDPTVRVSRPHHARPMGAGRVARIAFWVIGLALVVLALASVVLRMTSVR